MNESQIDQALEDLVEGEKTWASLSLAARRGLLDAVRALTVRHATEWVDAAVGIKQLDPASPLVGEEWMSGPYSLAAGLGALSESLAKLDAGRSPLDDAEFGYAPGGRTTVKALPLNTFDQLLLSGFSAEVWLQPGIEKAEAIRSAGLAQRDPSRTNGVGAVLGAGNIFSIAPLDTIYELYANNRVVALKLNPITDPLLPVLTKVLAPFIAVGAVRILTGGAETGTYLVRHKLVDHVHMTGSALTHDAIVFGTGEEGARRKAADEPVLDKEMTAELGGVSPTIVLPGVWNKADIEFQANHVATQRLHNNGYNCVAAQVVVLPKRWAQRDEFIAAIRKAVNDAPARAAYYPGSDVRVATADASYPDAQHLGAHGARVLVVDPADREALLRTEYFGPVLGVIELDVPDENFAEEAVRVANDEFVGTLGVNIIAHPDTIKGMGDKFDHLVEKLRYGTIAINAWTGVGYLTPTATWGAFPGHKRNDIQSGTGVVHNAFLLDRPERTVVRGPFRPAPRSVFRGEWSLSPKPPWFVNNRTSATTGRLLVDFAGAPGWGKLPAIFASALRG
ncbi:aldehyde dehydrogenase family protein [Mycolicibacterium fortuitum]|uniref:Aldehyde dehydrogenase n=2 Tax=Mycolicibacterium fortuitum TaxID=1766 RepID=A0A378V1L2_MYCFO|nr:aldehyde dehydrogenase family protein [Mycolicibacterium fortuitum]MCA4722865.1 aldehyde dehydrogenase family protein [Mycolicibacterium fortuitum]MCV7141947.1 aldehyde dehydrogenase family protein [Mycolicibacterium fortuitum]MDV7193848.1 aldehyde dehydrogenase family protein [Mycolicibacterium fortuitum]MDV7207775.1 aldehyde dehydrogenase family protein [Mycolicibacterium fortuitum]MDV7228949.1 aldehyde dehydrogenase family protein [Mycolicibacterium fortuitum]